MKTKIALISVLIWASASAASALPFSDTIDFTGDTFTADGITKDGIFLNDTPNTLDPGDPGYIFAYTYTHDLLFSPEAASVENAYLDVTFTGNRDSFVEAWFIYDLGYLDDTQDTVINFKRLSLGCFGGLQLTVTQDYDWATQTFDLTDLVADVSGSSWSIAFSIDENTPGANEQMFLAESTLYGTYEPVPEPGTMLLFGTGIAGLLGISRRKMK
jgi:hypothetical protein